MIAGEALGRADTSRGGCRRSRRSRLHARTHGVWPAAPLDAIATPALPCSLLLLTDGGELVLMHAEPSLVASVRSGQAVEAAGAWLTSPGGRGGGAVARGGQPQPVFHATAIRPAASGGGPSAASATASGSPAAGGGGAPGAAPATISALFVPIAALTAPGVACPGTGLPFRSAADVRRAVFEERNPGGSTFGGAVGQCSKGRSRLTQASSLVAEPVELPCSGWAHT